MTTPNLSRCKRVVAQCCSSLVIGCGALSLHGFLSAYLGALALNRLSAIEQSHKLNEVALGRTSALGEGALSVLLVPLLLCRVTISQLCSDSDSKKVKAARFSMGYCFGSLAAIAGGLLGVWLLASGEDSQMITYGKQTVSALLGSIISTPAVGILTMILANCVVPKLINCCQRSSDLPKHVQFDRDIEMAPTRG